MRRFSIPISVKIFGISSSMLALLLGVSYINYRNIARVNGELFDLANYLTKLTEHVAIINVHVLEQEIHYERAVRILETDTAGSAELNAEIRAFEERGDQVDEELVTARQLASLAIQKVQEDRDRLEFVRVESLLGVLEQDHQDFHDRSIEIFDLMRRDDRATARVLD
ncbi:MAG: hypothetical protein AAGF75_13345, partial [Cyanobacteria bacterium P01_H01_bin.130]